MHPSLKIQSAVTWLENNTQRNFHDGPGTLTLHRVVGPGHSEGEGELTNTESGNSTKGVFHFSCDSVQNNAGSS